MGDNAGQLFLDHSNSDRQKTVAGDFDGDGKSDLLMLTALQQPHQGKGLLLSSTGAGKFSNRFVSFEGLNFIELAAQPNVSAVAGDLNGDGLDDVVLTGGVGWNTQPVAFAAADGDFTVTNRTTADFAAWAAEPAQQGLITKVVVGDLNKDGKDDIALAGSASWFSTRVAISNGDGTFVEHAKSLQDFNQAASRSTSDLLAGEFPR